jgi:tRNA modification GTPase
MLSIHDSDTIVALATPYSTSAIAVIRLSGPLAIDSIKKVCKYSNKERYTSNSVYFNIIVDRQTQTVVDEVMVAVFRAPHSYTKEDVVEISCHGNPYIIDQLIRLLIQQGCRLAHPGEFTFRAFMNGALDLSQAEAVADLIAASSSTAHQQALAQLRGGISNQLSKMRTSLIDLAALFELELDFSEEDVEFVNRSQLIAQIKALDRVLAELESSFFYGNAVKHGVPTAIIGKPNAGKSTLLNRLLNEQRAIVSEIPGTTRDVIEEVLIIDGYTFRLLDTAGLRQTENPIETEGIHRTLDKIGKAELILYLFDSLLETVADATAHLAELGLLGDPRLVIVANKAESLAKDVPYPDDVLLISAQTGWGIDQLKALMTNRLLARKPTDMVITSVRHLEAIQRCRYHLRQVVAGVQTAVGSELIALDLRCALDELGSITGEISHNDVLSSIFSNFCIGK